MSILARLAIAATAITLFHSPLVAQLPIKPVPTAIQAALNDFQQDWLAGQAEAGLVADLTTAYLDVMAGFHPDEALADCSQVYADSFGQTFVLGTHGIESWGPPGAFDPSLYSTVLSYPDGQATTLNDLQTWQVDLSQPGLPPIVYPTNWPNPVEAYFYSAQFGTAQPHVGLLLRFEQANRSQLGFVPMVEVPDGGIISAADAGAFIGMILTDGFATTSFWDWALQQGGYQSLIKLTRQAGYLPTLPGTSQSSNCDMEALAECLKAAKAAAAAALATENQRHKDRVDEIMDDFADGKEWELGAWTGAGAVAGALVGSPAAGVGAVPGAIVGGLIGAIGGSVGWLFSTAGDAETAQEDLDKEDETHAENRCTIARDFGAAVLNCVAEHCPELYSQAAAAVANMLAGSGC